MNNAIVSNREIMTRAKKMLDENFSLPLQLTILLVLLKALGFVFSWGLIILGAVSVALALMFWMISSLSLPFFEFNEFFFPDLMDKSDITLQIFDYFQDLYFYIFNYILELKESLFSVSDPGISFALFAIALLAVSLIALSALVYSLCIFFFDLGIKKSFLDYSRNQDAPLKNIYAFFRWRSWRILLAHIIILILIQIGNKLFVIPAIIVHLLFSQAYFLAVDRPQTGPFKLLGRSFFLMKKNMFRLLGLYIRFIPWFILCFISLGFALLWVFPYFSTSMAIFYNELLKQDVKNEPESTAKQAIPVEKKA